MSVVCASCAGLCRLAFLKGGARTVGWEERRKENLVIDTHLEGERVKTQTCICMHFDRFGENHRDEVTMMSGGRLG